MGLPGQRGLVSRRSWFKRITLQDSEAEFRGDGAGPPTITRAFRPARPSFRVALDVPLWPTKGPAWPKGRRLDRRIAGPGTYPASRPSIPA